MSSIPQLSIASAASGVTYRVVEHDVARIKQLQHALKELLRLILQTDRQFDTTVSVLLTGQDVAQKNPKFWTDFQEIAEINPGRYPLASSTFPQATSNDWKPLINPSESFAEMKEFLAFVEILHPLTYQGADGSGNPYLTFPTRANDITQRQAICFHIRSTYAPLIWSCDIRITNCIEYIVRGYLTEADVQPNLQGSFQTLSLDLASCLDLTSNDNSTTEALRHILDDPASFFTDVLPGLTGHSVSVPDWVQP